MCKLYPRRKGLRWLQKILTLAASHVNHLVTSRWVHPLSLEIFMIQSDNDVTIFIHGLMRSSNFIYGLLKQELVQHLVLLSYIILIPH